MNHLAPLSLDDLKISHHFVGDQYAKITEIDAGSVLTSHSHNFTHQSALLIGRATVRVNGYASMHEAPAIFTIKAGEIHEVYAHHDCLWACLWDNPERITDPDAFDRKVIS